ncbi:MAG: hypothetical protein ACXU89_27365 [Xanthobacteraceae bacterium]
MFAHPIVRHAVRFRKHGRYLRRYTRSASLLIGLSQFVPLQISKIEPICVAAWAAGTTIPGLTRKRIAVNARGDAAAWVRDEPKLVAHRAVTLAAAIPEAAAGSPANS